MSKNRHCSHKWRSLDNRRTNTCIRCNLCYEYMLIIYIGIYRDEYWQGLLKRVWVRFGGRLSPVSARSMERMLFFLDASLLRVYPQHWTGQYTNFYTLVEGGNENLGIYCLSQNNTITQPKRETRQFDPETNASITKKQRLTRWCW